VIAAAYLLDWIAGDPEWFPHPVRAMGRSIQIGERWLRRPGQSAGEELLAGAALTIGVVGASYWFATKADGVFEIALGWTCLASRNLVDESLAVIRAQDLPHARQRLSRIVGRDTHALSEAEIHRAVIETLAESACDGIVAPMLYMTIGGVPLALAYKAINTLDSMIGHADLWQSSGAPGRRRELFALSADRFPDCNGSGYKCDLGSEDLASRRQKTQKPQCRSTGKRNGGSPAGSTRGQEYLRG
jgi:cobalamin biosynthesis protein CobD/CbiB